MERHISKLLVVLVCVYTVSGQQAAVDLPPPPIFAPSEVASANPDTSGSLLDSDVSHVGSDHSVSGDMGTHLPGDIHPLSGDAMLMNDSFDVASASGNLADPHNAQPADTMDINALLDFGMGDSTLTVPSNIVDPSLAVFNDTANLNLPGHIGPADAFVPPALDSFNMTEPSFVNSTDLIDHHAIDQSGHIASDIHPNDVGVFAPAHDNTAVHSDTAVAPAIDATDALLIAASDSGDTLVDAVGGTVETIADAAGGAVETLADAAGGAVETLADVAGGAVETLADAAGGAAEHMAPIIAADAMINAAGGTTDNIVIPMVGDTAESLVDAAGGAVDTITDGAGGAAENIATLMAADAIANAAAGAAHTPVDSTGGIMDNIVPLMAADALAEDTGSVAEAVAPIIAADALANVAAGGTDNMIIPMVGDTAENLVDAAGSAVDTLTDATSSAVDTLTDATSNAIDTLTDGAGGAAENIATMMAADAIANAAAGGAHTPVDPTGGIMDTIVPLVATDAIADATSSAVDTLTDSASSAVDTFADATSNAVDTLSDEVGGAAENIATMMAADAIANAAAGGAAHTPSGTAGGALDTIVPLLATEAIADATSSAVDTLTDATSSAVDTITDGAGDAAGNIATLMAADAIANAAAGAAHTPVDSTGGIMDNIVPLMAADALADDTGSVAEAVAPIIAADALANAAGGGTDNVIIPMVGDTAENLVDAAGSAVDTLTDAASSAVDTMTDGAGGAAENIATLMAADAIANAAAGGAHTPVDPTGGIMDNIVPLVATDAIADATSSAVDTLTDATSSAVDTLTDATSSAVDTLTDATEGSSENIATMVAANALANAAAAGVSDNMVPIVPDMPPHIPVDTIGGSVDTIVPLIATETVADATGDAVDSFADAASSTLDNISPLIAAGALANAARGTMNLPIDTTGGLINDNVPIVATDSITGGAAGAADTIVVPIGGDAREKLVDAASGAVETIADASTSAIDSLADAASSVVDNMAPLSDDTENTIVPLLIGTPGGVIPPPIHSAETPLHPLVDMARSIATPVDIAPPHIFGTVEPVAAQPKDSSVVTLPDQVNASNIPLPPIFDTMDHFAPPAIEPAVFTIPGAQENDNVTSLARGNADTTDLFAPPSIDLPDMFLPSIEAAITRAIKEKDPNATLTTDHAGSSKPVSINIADLKPLFDNSSVLLDTNTTLSTSPSDPGAIFITDPLTAHTDPSSPETTLPNRENSGIALTMDTSFTPPLFENTDPLVFEVAPAPISPPVNDTFSATATPNNDTQRSNQANIQTIGIALPGTMKLDLPPTNTNVILDKSVPVVNETGDIPPSNDSKILTTANLDLSAGIPITRGTGDMSPVKVPTIPGQPEETFGWEKPADKGASLMPNQIKPKVVENIATASIVIEPGIAVRTKEPTFSTGFPLNETGIDKSKIIAGGNMSDDSSPTVSTAKAETTTVRPVKYTVPFHPPPIFSSGMNLPVLQEDSGISRTFREHISPEIKTAVQEFKTTTEAPPPAIPIPAPNAISANGSPTSASEMSTFVELLKGSPVETNPKYMNVAELANLALQKSRNDKTIRAGYPNSLGFQVFFKTLKPITKETTLTTTTLSPPSKTLSEGHQLVHSSWNTSEFSFEKIPFVGTRSASQSVANSAQPIPQTGPEGIGTLPQTMPDQLVIRDIKSVNQEATAINSNVLESRTFSPDNLKMKQLQEQIRLQQQFQHKLQQQLREQQTRENELQNQLQRQLQQHQQRQIVPKSDISTARFNMATPLTTEPPPQSNIRQINPLLPTRFNYEVIHQTNTFDNNAAQLVPSTEPRNRQNMLQQQQVVKMSPGNFQLPTTIHSPRIDNVPNNRFVQPLATPFHQKVASLTTVTESTPLNSAFDRVSDNVFGARPRSYVYGDAILSQSENRWSTPKTNTLHRTPSVRDQFNRHIQQTYRDKSNVIEATPLDLTKNVQASSSVRALGDTGMVQNQLVQKTIQYTPTVPPRTGSEVRRIFNRYISPPSPFIPSHVGAPKPPVHLQDIHRRPLSADRPRQSTFLSPIARGRDNNFSPVAAHFQSTPRETVVISRPSIYAQFFEPSKLKRKPRDPFMQPIIRNSNVRNMANVIGATDIKQLQGQPSFIPNASPMSASNSPHVSYMMRALTTPSPEIAAITTTPTPRTTTTTVPTVPPTVDPNPPPIYDTKIRHTFMPFPTIELATNAPARANESTQVTWDNSASGANPNFPEQCRKCVFVNDRCLLPDPVHCNMYTECVRQGSFVRAFQRDCALGSFFDRKSYLCVDPKNTDCPTDRCREPNRKWYAIHGHCKHYWSCQAREGGGIYAQSECCPDMGGFDEELGCIENPNCTESCSTAISKNPPKGCHLRKTSSKTVYYDANANMERPCAPGTLFNELQCTCVQDVTLERNASRPGGTPCTCGNETTCACRDALQASTGAGTCSPMLALTFDGGHVEDMSNTKQHIGIEGVPTSPSGEAIFTGSGKLVLWRYANLMFPVVFAIRLRFQMSPGGPQLQTLVSNCDKEGNQEPTFHLYVDTKFHEVVFHVNTYESVSKVFKIIYQDKGWSDVVLIYDGERIVGSVDGRSRNILAGGGIETRPYPLAVGACGKKQGFRGLLDDIHIYEDCIPDDMYGIFMSVLE